MAQPIAKSAEFSGHCASFGNRCVHSMNIAAARGFERGFI
jgi:hypothetical protein